MVRFPLPPGPAGRMLIVPPAGFSVASKAKYPTKVDLVIPETVGRNLTVWVLDEKLRSFWNLAR